MISFTEKWNVRVKRWFMPLRWHKKPRNDFVHSPAHLYNKWTRPSAWLFPREHNNEFWLSFYRRTKYKVCKHFKLDTCRGLEGNRAIDREWEAWIVIVIPVLTHFSVALVYSTLVSDSSYAEVIKLWDAATGRKNRLAQIVLNMTPVFYPVLDCRPLSNKIIVLILSYCVLRNV
jgi:hypothetical protein